MLPQTPLVLLVLLPAVRGISVAWNSSFLLRFIKDAQKEVNFDIIFVTASSDNDLNDVIRELTVGGNMAYMSHSKLTDFRTRNDMRGLFSTWIFIKHAEDDLLGMYLKVSKGRRIAPVILLMTKIVYNMDFMKMLSAWAKKNYVSQCSVYFQDRFGVNNMFEFRFNSDLSYYNITEEKFFENAESNARISFGLDIHTPIRQDVSRVFKYVNSNGELIMAGAAAEIFKTFVELYGGRIIEYPLANSSRNVDMGQVLGLIKENKIFASIHPYEAYDLSEVSQSYPLSVVNWCLMVPVAPRSSIYLFLFEPFQTSVWILISVGVVYVSSMEAVRALLCAERNGLGRSFMFGVCILINATLPYRIATGSCSKLFFYTGFFIFGFSVTNYYTSVLGSFLAVNIYKEQSYTIESLIEANVSILVVEYERDFLYRSGYFSDAFKNLFVTVDVDTFATHRDTLNTSYAYPVTEDRWAFLAMQQENVKPPLFEFSDICFGYYPMGFPMDADAPLMRDMKYFIYRVHSSGLFQHYASTAFGQAVEGKLVRRLGAHYSAKYAPGSLEVLQIIFHFWGFAIAVSICVLLGELAISKFVNPPFEFTV